MRKISQKDIIELMNNHNNYGNSGQLHRVELELINSEQLTRFVYYTCIRYED